MMTRQPTDSARLRWPSDLRGAVLVEVWLIVLIVDRMAFPIEARTLLGVGALFAAAAGLLMRNPIMAALAFALDLALLLVALPEIANHLTLLIMVDIALIAMLAGWTGRSSTDPEAARPPVALRYALVGLYLVTAVHKLNSSYTDVTVSCARYVTDLTLTWFSLPPAGEVVGTVNVVMGVMLEFAIPLLLIFRRTRTVGLLIGLVFHGLLALVPIGGVASFSVFMLGLYIMFFDTTTLERLSQWRTLLPAALFKPPLAWGAAAAGTGLVTAINLVMPGANRLGVRLVVFVLFAMVLAVVVAVVVGDRSFPRADRLDWRFTPGAAAIILFMLVAATLPYLGGRTQIAFSMFSNLRTEVAPNHELLPQAYLFGYQDDLVTVPVSPHKKFDNISGGDLVVPAYEVGRRLEEVEGEVTELTVEIDGQLVTLTGADLHERFPAPTWIESKFIRMRATERSGPVSCRH